MKVTQEEINEVMENAPSDFKRGYEAGMTQSITVDDRTKEILRLEALAKEINKRLKARKEELLRVMKQNKTLTLKTESYTVIRAKRNTITITNEHELEKDLASRQVPIDYEYRLSEQTIAVAKNLIKSGEELKGTEKKETEYLSIRKQ